ELGEETLAGRTLHAGRAGADHGREPGGIDHLFESLWWIDLQHPADLLEVREHGVLCDRLTARGQRAAAPLDLIVRGLGLLAQIVPRALQVLTEALDRIETEDLDQGFPLLGLGLIDEVGERAPAQKERLSPDGLKRLGLALVGEHDGAAQRAGRDDLDRGGPAVAPHVADGMLSSLVAQGLDLPREVPLQRVGNRALAGAVVAVDRDAVAPAKVHDHLAGDATERSHHEALDLFSHRRIPRRAVGSPAIGRRAAGLEPRPAVGRAPAADRRGLRAAPAGTPPRSDDAWLALRWRTS